MFDVKKKIKKSNILIGHICIWFSY